MATKVPSQKVKNFVALCEYAGITELVEELLRCRRDHQ